MKIIVCARVIMQRSSNMLQLLQACNSQHIAASICCVSGNIRPSDDLTAAERLNGRPNGLIHTARGHKPTRLDTTRSECVG